MIKKILLFDSIFFIYLCISKIRFFFHHIGAHLIGPSPYFDMFWFLNFIGRNLKKNKIYVHVIPVKSSWSFFKNLHTVLLSPLLLFRLPTSVWWKRKLWRKQSRKDQDQSQEQEEDQSQEQEEDQSQEQRMISHRNRRRISHRNRRIIRILFIMDKPNS